MCQQHRHLTRTRCSGISRSVANRSRLCPACSMPTTSILIKPMMTMTNNTHAPTVFPPPTNMNCIFYQSHSHQPPSHHREPTPLYMTTWYAQHATKRQLNPRNPSSVLTDSSNFIWNASPKHVLILNDCAGRTHGVFIPVLPGYHPQQHPIPSIRSPMLPNHLPSINSVSYIGTVIPWLQNYPSLQSSWKATKLMWRWSRKQSSAKRTPPHQSLASTLCVFIEMTAAQDIIGAVVLLSTSIRAFSTLHHPVQPPTRWSSKRSLSTLLDDVNFPLLTYTFPHIILATPPTTKMTSHGSIICQKCLTSSMGTSMLITVTGMIMASQTLVARRTTTGWMCYTLVTQHEPRVGWPKCWNKYDGCFAGGYGYGSLLLMGNQSRTWLWLPSVVIHLG